MPKASPLPDNPLLPENLSDEEYITAFLKEFGGAIGKTVFWTDVIGEIMPINKDLFTARNGIIKVNKNGRGKYMRMLALGLIEPDEVWLSWKQDPLRKWVLQKRYIKIWDTTDGSHCLTIFDLDKSTWTGTTSFAPKDGYTEESKNKYLNKLREGLLLYKKSPK